MTIANRILKGSWVVRKTIWPYDEGHGVYHPRSNTVLDTGLTKKRAQQICDGLNSPDKEQKQ